MKIIIRNGDQRNLKKRSIQNMRLDVAFIGRNAAIHVPPKWRLNKRHYIASKQTRRQSRSWLVGFCFAPTFLRKQLEEPLHFPDAVLSITGISSCRRLLCICSIVPTNTHKLPITPFCTIGRSMGPPTLRPMVLSRSRPWLRAYMVWSIWPIRQSHRLESSWLEAFCLIKYVHVMRCL